FTKNKFKMSQSNSAEVERIRKYIKELEEENDKLTTDNDDLTTKNTNLTNRVTKLQKENATLTDTITESNNTAEDILINLNVRFGENDTLSAKLTKITTVSKEISEIN
ncbi:12227_t:CDS:1, partial [Gigaspora margarita]